LTEDNQTVSRRHFAKFLTLGGLVVAAGGAWALLRSRFSKSRSNLARVVAHVDELLIGGSKIFQYPAEDDPCILVRPAADIFVAYSRICTHADCPVFYRPQQNALGCPCHQGFFSVTDGSVLSGPPPRPLPRIILERRGQDIVALRVVKS
jgi:Rieske Fe-S protein